MPQCSEFWGLWINLCMMGSFGSNASARIDR